MSSRNTERGNGKVNLFPSPKTPSKPQNPFGSFRPGNESSDSRGKTGTHGSSLTHWEREFGQVPQFFPRFKNQSSQAPDPCDPPEPKRPRKRQAYVPSFEHWWDNPELPLEIVLPQSQSRTPSEASPSRGVGRIRTAGGVEVATGLGALRLELERGQPETPPGSPPLPAFRPNLEGVRLSRRGLLRGQLGPQAAIPAGYSNPPRPRSSIRNLTQVPQTNSQSNSNLQITNVLPSTWWHKSPEISRALLRALRS